MGQPTWRPVKSLKIPEREAGIWTPALDYISVGKLYRILVEPIAGGEIPEQAGITALPEAAAAAEPVPPAEPPPFQDQQWTPESGKPCTADGDPTLTRSVPLILEGCAPGALIAKIGGSTADIKPDKEKITLFSVGRHCVFSVSDATKSGSLYLGVNDAPAAITKVQGQLEVTIFEAL